MESGGIVEATKFLQKVKKGLTFIKDTVDDSKQLLLKYQ